MTGFRILLRKELLEQWRTTRLPVVATVFLLVGLSSPLLARFTPQILEAVGGGQFSLTLPTPTAADAYDQLAKNVGQFGALIAVLLAMGAVATEKERGTAPRPAAGSTRWCCSSRWIRRASSPPPS